MSEQNGLSEETYLSDEDYVERACPLCMTDDKPIPIGRVIAKLDEYFAKNDEAGAERHLRYWLAEAEASNDARGEVAVLSELIGITRKRGEGDESLAFSDRALALVSGAGFDDSITGATVYLNAATAYKAFGRAAQAIPLYEKADELYFKYLKPGDLRFAGLDNNMALALLDTSRFDEAEERFLRALALLSPVSGTEPEQAVTYTNLASLTEKRDGLEAGEAKIAAYLKDAKELLDACEVRDANYAYVCTKCAPIFGYYGYFADEETLALRARSIYEGT